VTRQQYRGSRHSSSGGLWGNTGHAQTASIVAIAMKVKYEERSQAVNAVNATEQDRLRRYGRLNAADTFRTRSTPMPWTSMIAV
jgi:hypothetical protein